MTLEEKILQTDQYYSGDFLQRRTKNGKVTAVDMQRFDALGCSTIVSAVCNRAV